MDLAASLGCLPCAMDGYLDTPAQLHHPRAEAGLSERGDDMEVIPMCEKHHLHGGTYPDGRQFPSVHGDVKAFRACYGEDAALSKGVRYLVERIDKETIGKRA